MLNIAAAAARYPEQEQQRHGRCVIAINLIWKLSKGRTVDYSAMGEYSYKNREGGSKWLGKQGNNFNASFRKMRIFSDFMVDFYLKWSFTVE